MTQEEDIWADIDKSLAQTVTRLEKQEARRQVAKRNNQSALFQPLVKSKLSDLNRKIEELSWLSVETIALFSEQSCSGCGSIHRLFLQYMTRQVRGKDFRLMRNSRPDFSLPKSVLVNPAPSHLCSDCCSDHGFDFPSTPAIVSSSSSPFAPSPTYSPDDPNASFEKD